jgi:uncharacterized protein YoxC
MIMPIPIISRRSVKKRTGRTFFCIRDFFDVQSVCQKTRFLSRVVILLALQYTSRVMEQPVSHPQTEEKKMSRLEHLAFEAPQHIGSVPSLIIHTIFFVGIFALQVWGFTFDQIMLILTTAVSLEAIYLAIFIQMTVNRHAEQIEEVSEDVVELSEDIEDISEDVDEIVKDIDIIQEDVKEISEDVEEISEDVEELGEEIEKDDQEDAVERTEDQRKLERMEKIIADLLSEIRDLKHEKK